jgi:hypothetical protein
MIGGMTERANRMKRRSFIAFLGGTNSGWRSRRGP